MVTPKVTQRPFAGAKNPRWKGGRYVASQGYVMVLMPEHPRANRDGHVLEHIVIAERALGRYLVPPEEVHHVDENRSNNAPTNLVICPDRAYHKLLHKRLRAFKACGDPNAKRCYVCAKYDRQVEIVTWGKTKATKHRDCANASLAEWLAANPRDEVGRAKLREYQREYMRKRRADPVHHAREMERKRAARAAEKIAKQPMQLDHAAD